MQEKFIEFNKLSKKKQKEINAKKRNLWMCSPVTKVCRDKTKYNRNDYKNLTREY